ncbi:MAG TPA: hypothetical protein VHX20_17960 [Terracidiphilus sp.]|jgi:hypothetical protein|nr:hypothetical protein [Terracidiphilus sp.]
MLRNAVLFAAAAATCVSLPAQQNFISSWGQRASATQAKQPAWPPPLITPFVGLIQVERTDFYRQTASNGTQTWNIDGNKGLNLIPFANIEVDTNLPPYLIHSSPSVVNGAGDMSFLLKYRFLSANASHGNYIMSASIQGTIPTGSYKNGSTDASVTPTVGIAKGVRWLDVQSTVGAGLPVENTARLGRAIAWNTAMQAHAAKYFWPEIEFNATYFKGGANDGKTQVFATPALLAAHKLRPENPRSRLAVCAGAGVQIATSRFHTYNHEIAVTARFLF